MPSVGILRIVDPNNPGSCCSCADQSGCDCISNNCSLSCRTRAGTASLCGYDEFGTPSTPPKKYRERRVTTVTPFTICQFGGSNSCTPPTCPSDYSDDYTAPNGVHMIGTLVNNGPGTAPNSTNYTAHCSATYLGSPVSCTIQLSFSNCAGVTFHDGETKDVGNSCVNGLASMLVPIGIGGTGSPTKCIVIGVFGVQVTGDTWDFTGIYSRDTSGGGCSSDCVLAQTNNSLRQTLSGNTCDPTGGAGGPLPYTDPATAYGSGITQTVIDGAEQDSKGNGCVTAGPPSIAYTGTVKEVLTKEDTDQDAIDRAMICTSWGSPEDCTPEAGGTAFITPRTTGVTFGFRECQVRGVAATIVGHTYQMTIGIYNRVYGTSGPFVSAGSIVITFTASDTISTTPWQLIPNTEGFETRAVSCNVIDITGP